MVFICKIVSERCVLIPYTRGYAQKEQCRLCSKTAIFLNPLVCINYMVLFSAQSKNGIPVLVQLMALCSNVFYSLVQVLNWKVFLLPNLNFSALQFNWFCVLARRDAHNPASVPFIILYAFFHFSNICLFSEVNNFTPFNLSSSDSLSKLWSLLLPFLNTCSLAMQLLRWDSTLSNRWSCVILYTMVL